MEHKKRTIIFIIIVIIILFWYWFMIWAYPNLEYVSLENLLKTKRLKTGDLICFKPYNNKYSLFMCSFYSHIGIIYVDPTDKNQTPYLFEATNAKYYSKKNWCPPNGIVLSEAKVRLSKYKGCLVYKELNQEISYLSQLDFKNFIKWAKNHMYYDINVVGTAFKKGILRCRCNLNTNCGELVFLSLVKLGLLSMEDYDQGTFHHLLWMCRIKNLNHGFFYYNPKYIEESPFS